MSRRSICFALSLAASLTILPFTLPANAGEPTAADSETALQLFKDGKALRESGDLPGALGKLRAAYALVQTPITALELGRTQMALGLLVEARDVLLTVPRIPVRANESAKAGEARVEAEKLAAEIRPRLGTITVHPKGASDAPPKVSVDGDVLPADAATLPRVVNPGSHMIVVEANGQRVQTEVTLVEGQDRDVDMDLPPRVVAPPVVAPPVLPPAPMEEKKRSPLVYAGFGTAIVGIGVGTITGILTLSKASTLKDTCHDGHCPASAQSDLDSTSTTGTISTISFAIGAAGAVVGVIGLFMSGAPAETPPPPSPAAASRGLRIVPTANGLSGTF